MNIWIETNSQILKFDIPMAVHERTFEDFCDFKIAKDKYINDENREFDATDLIDILSHMVEGELDQLPLTGDNESVSNLIDNDYTLTIGDEITLWGLYAHIINMIKLYVPDHVPETFKLNWRGNNFSVTQRRVGVNLLNRPYTTGETIEALEYQRKASHNIEHAPLEAGNIEFNLGLTEFAILVRKEGEKLPSKKKVLDAFIEERKNLFRHLPLNHVLDLRFFFISSLMLFDQTNDSNSFGKVLHTSKTSRNRRWIKTGN